MAATDIDFDGTGSKVDTTTTPPTTPPQTPPNAEPDKSSLEGDNDDINKTNPPAQDGDDKNKEPLSSTGELNAGDSIEFDGATYTVAENGDIVDSEGKVFKPAAEVKDWLASLEEEENPFDIAAIQEAIGTEVLGEDGKPVEFTNDAEGVKSYIESVIELRSKDIQEGAINKLYADNPLLKQFADYVTVNGSPAGFGELPDRSEFVVSKDNEAQQEAIVRMAAKEFGNMSLNDNYIKYLKDSGGLYDEAVAQLKALQDKDKAVREEISRRAEAAREEELREFTEYWNKIKNVINGKTIAGYKLPDSFVKEVDGKKQTLTPNDFYDYLYKQTVVDTDGNRITAYQRDLANESQDDLLNRELISAWLMFTGGTYKDLINMAVKEDAVRTLRLKAKDNRAHKAVKLVKPNNDKVNPDDILL